MATKAEHWFQLTTTAMSEWEFYSRYLIKNRLKKEMHNATHEIKAIN